MLRSVGERHTWAVGDADHKWPLWEMQTTRGPLPYLPLSRKCSLSPQGSFPTVVLDVKQMSQGYSQYENSIGSGR